MKTTTTSHAPIVVIPTELEYFTELPSELEAAGCMVRRPRDPTDRHELMALVRDADVFLASVFLGIDRELLLSAPRLRGVVSLVIGVDTIDVPTCDELGLIVANGAVRENPVSAAEGAVLLILTLLKGLKAKEQALRAGTWRPTIGESNLVSRKTVGIVGLGNIGRRVAERLQGWEVTLLACGPHVTPESAPPGVEAVSLEELLRRSDVVSIHARLTPETRGLIGSRELALMKPSALLVNTARGAIVDELALAEALRHGRLAGAAVDVWSQEPPPPDHPLLAVRSDRVILTGHCVGHGAEMVPAMIEAAVENVTRIAHGELPRYLVNPDIIPAWRARLTTLGALR